MYNAEGVGLAAPQVGVNKKIFIIDANPLFPKDQEISDFEKLNSKKVFINPEITEIDGDQCFFNEGCLSIPEIRAEIKRPNMIKVEFLDENFNHNSVIFKGLLARVILHENDHINGVLFTDKISSFKRKIIQIRLVLQYLFDIVAYKTTSHTTTITSCFCIARFVITFTI